jgi:hypothetical protein
MGVGGYAPKQIEGTFRIYGMKYKPRYVLIGYCSSTFVRESAFFDEKAAIKTRNFTGSLHQLAHLESAKMTKYVTVALYLIGKSLIHTSSDQSPNLAYGKNNANGPFKHAMYDIKNIGREKELISAIKSNSKEWRSTLEAFNNIQTMAKSINAETIIIFFPLRGAIYYQKALGKILPDSYLQKNEKEALMKFCKANDIMFIDPSQALIDYTNSLSSQDANIVFPYYHIDGHLTKIGNYIVAKHVLKAIKCCK